MKFSIGKTGFVIGEDGIIVGYGREGTNGKYKGRGISIESPQSDISNHQFERCDSGYRTPRFKPSSPEIIRETPKKMYHRVR